MFRHLRPFLLLSLLLVAACGGSNRSTPTAPAPKQARIKPSAQQGVVNAGVTGGGIGTAAQGGPAGIKQLPSTKVQGASNTEQGVGAGATCANTDIAPAADNIPTVVTATLCLLNGERVDAGLAPFKENPKLDAAARVHSADMVAKQYFDHVGTDGTDPVDRLRAVGYIPSAGAWTIGENLAWGTGALATPKEIVSAWMKSAGHRANILRPQFKEIGFGVVVGNPRAKDGAGATYTNAFGGITKVATAPRRATARRARQAKVAKARAAKKRKRSLRARIAKG